MIVEIDIADRIYDSIERYCSDNGLEVNLYMLEAIENRINTDRFGDLNEIMYGKPKKKPVEVKETPVNVVKDKKTEEQPPSEEKHELPVVVLKNEITDKPVEIEDKPQKRIKRTIKAK